MDSHAVPPAALQMHFTWPKSGYLPGELVTASVTSIETGTLLSLELSIGESAGSGFAGQVYQAWVTAAPPASWPEKLAVKVLRPRAGWKRLVRDSLFWLCFQAPFAPQVDGAAVVSGMLWQSVLRAAAGSLYGPFSVARPLGYFWDPRLVSFVELHEWIESRPSRYETDPQLVARWLRLAKGPGQTEMARKQRFMQAMADLCCALGAVGLARQYEWYTLVAQANVLTRINPEAREQNEFTVVDCRVGLAFPFFLPFTPIHLRIALAGLRRGVLVHYDEVDFSRLKAYLNAHPAVAERLRAEPVLGLVERLEQSDRDYRASLPDLWQTRARWLADPALRQRQVSAGLARWVRLGLAAPQAAEGLADHLLILGILLLLYPLPVLGPLVIRLVAHPGYRAHLRSLLSDRVYRQTWLSAARVQDLAEWAAFQRISPQHAACLAGCVSVYLLEKLTCAGLPPAAQRWLTDPTARRRWLHAHLVQPIRLLVSQPERTAWLDGIVQCEQDRGLIHAERAAILRCQIREPRMQQIIHDLGFAAGLEVFSRLVYLVLGLYGLSTGDLLPLGIAAFSPIPPSGISRLFYVLARSVQDVVRSLVNEHRLPRRRQVLVRLGELLIAPWRWVGNLFPLLEVSAAYPRLALLLAEHFANRAVHNVPVFGGRGKLLEYWVFQAIYNIPVSIKALRNGFRE